MFKIILNWTISEEQRNDILEKFFVNKLKETFLLFEIQFIADCWLVTLVNMSIVLEIRLTERVGD